MPKIMVCGAFSSLMSAKAAGGYEFSRPLRERYLDVLALLERNGFETLSAHRADGFGETDWIENFVERDLAWVESCDAQLVMLPAGEGGEACRSDGTMIEMGYALARGKPLIILADDPDNERNSFFLRSFVARKVSALVSWADTSDFERPLIDALNGCFPSQPVAEREHRTDVDKVLEDLRRETQPHRVKVAGMDLVVLPGVLSPRLSHAPDALMARWYIPASSRVLDLGCGSGVLGLAALSEGAGSLVALDVNPAAVDTTTRNIGSIGYAERAEARLSDAYSALRPGECFDVIIFAAPYWNRQPRDDLDRSCFDSDYAFFSTAVDQAHNWLASDGSMFIIFSDQGDIDKALGVIENSQMRVARTHLMRPTQPGGHIRIIWELKRRVPRKWLPRLLDLPPRPLAG